MHKPIFIFLLLITSKALSQPYVDPLQLRYTYAFRSAGKNQATPFSHVWVGSDIPVKLRERTYLLLGPYYENWQLDSAATKLIYPALHSICFPAGLLLPLNKQWLLSLTVIPRFNAGKLFDDNSFQFGGAGFVSYEQKPGKKLRLGVYMNSEFFGLFVVPLVGADWQMNSRNYFFGLLPGRFTWEHKFSRSLYAGLTFRAITNSYRLQNGRYIRLDDNQLSGFLDVYPHKRICFTVEPGYGMFRKIRTGISSRNYTTNSGWGDGWFIKLSAAFRIRLDEPKKLK